MTKNQLAKEVAVSEKLHLSTSIQAVDGFIRVVTETLLKGESITLRGFGTLAVVNVPERQARNLHTGEPCTIPAHRTIKLRVSKDLVKNLNAEKEATK
jgi:DNA-binding protein HU-beta